MRVSIPRFGVFMADVMTSARTATGTRFRRMGVLLAASLLVGASASPAAAPIRVMLLDGESGGPYHKWQATTVSLKKQLDETKLFDVDVVTAPPAGASF